MNRNWTTYEHLFAKDQTISSNTTPKQYYSNFNNIIQKQWLKTKETYVEVEIAFMLLNILSLDVMTYFLGDF